MQAHGFMPLEACHTIWVAGDVKSSKLCSVLDAKRGPSQTSVEIKRPPPGVLGPLVSRVNGQRKELPTLPCIAAAVEMCQVCELPPSPTPSLGACI